MHRRRTGASAKAFIADDLPWLRQPHLAAGDGCGGVVKCVITNLQKQKAKGQLHIGLAWPGPAAADLRQPKPASAHRAKGAKILNLDAASVR